MEQNIAAPIPCLIPDPSVYMCKASVWLEAVLRRWCFSAASLFASMCIVDLRVHHGGLMYGWMVSTSCMCSGKYLAMFSRLDGYGRPPPFFRARESHLCSGCPGGSVCILVIVFSTFLRSRNVGGGRFVSFSSAAVGVVRKHPVIAFMACRWTVENLLSCWVVGAVLSSGRCHITAA